MGKLITVLFHVVFENTGEMDKNIIHPQQKIIVQQFRDFVVNFLNNQFVFVSPKDVFRGLDPEKNHIMITFDDGYYNNIRILPILKEFNIPALFFISSDHVLNNECFWWDIVYRERIRLGASLNTIEDEIKKLKGKGTTEIRNSLFDAFGKKAFVPQTDLDRPFSPEELLEFAKNKNVELGIHTKDHSILTNCTRQKTRGVISQDIEQLSSITHGRVVPVISYPNGNFSRHNIIDSKLLGLKMGLTLLPFSNYLPLTTHSKMIMTLGRFFLWGDRDIGEQCSSMRSIKIGAYLRQRIKIMLLAKMQISSRYFFR